MSRIPCSNVSPLHRVEKGNSALFSVWTYTVHSTILFVAPIRIIRGESIPPRLDDGEERNSVPDSVSCDMEIGIPYVIPYRVM